MKLSFSNDFGKGFLIVNILLLEESYTAKLYLYIMDWRYILDLQSRRLN